MRRVPLSRGIYIVPSLCTTASLFCGFYAIVRSIGGDYLKACLALFIAAVFDMLDGRIARMTHSESDFGVEYDSLTDLASFGLAPVILLYMWGLHDLHRLGWLAAFVYFACGALRLARYNVQIGTIEKKRFQGLPVPAAALLLASLVIFFEAGDASDAWKKMMVLFFPFVLGPLMVSRIRYRSFKDLDLKSPNTFYILVGAVGVIMIIAANPENMLFLVAVGYMISGPIEEVILYLKGRKDLRTIRRMALGPGKKEDEF